ncbi:MAG: hypothetical protein LBR11_08860 [Deltaproteobacteria bacterium]|jgi:hypothetical protein|nr:hypothetical protein [Deltaproteobacteria bacterium]
MKADGADPKGLWPKTLAVCQQCLELDRQFAARLASQIADPEQDPLEPTLWEHFIDARRDLFDFTTMSLKVLTQSQEVPPQDSLEGQIREELLTSLSEMADLEEKLTAYLTKGLTSLKETIDNLAKSQAIFSGYASLDTKPPANHLDSLA